MPAGRIGTLPSASQKLQRVTFGGQGHPQPAQSDAPSFTTRSASQSEQVIRSVPVRAGTRGRRDIFSLFASNWAIAFENVAAPR
jgi:hypothetical protein